MAAGTQLKDFPIAGAKGQRAGAAVPRKLTKIPAERNGRGETQRWRAVVDRWSVVAHAIPACQRGLAAANEALHAKSHRNHGGVSRCRRAASTTNTSRELHALHASMRRTNCVRWLKRGRYAARRNGCHPARNAGYQNGAYWRYASSRCPESAGPNVPETPTPRANRNPIRLSERSPTKPRPWLGPVHGFRWHAQGQSGSQTRPLALGKKSSVCAPTTTRRRWMAAKPGTLLRQPSEKFSDEIAGTGHAHAVFCTQAIPGRHTQILHADSGNQGPLIFPKAGALTPPTAKAGRSMPSNLRGTGFRENPAFDNLGRPASRNVPRQCVWWWWTPASRQTLDADKPIDSPTPACRK